MDSEAACRLDREDPLAPFAAFFLKNTGRIYLDGNSLGLLCEPAKQAVLRVLDEWQNLAIDGWTEGSHPWFTMAERLAAQTAPLIGAQADEVIITNSTTVNLHQLLATFFHATRADRKRKILATAVDFPSDIHAIRSQLLLRGLDPDRDLVRVPSADGLTIDESEIIARMTKEIAIAILPSVLYTSGQLLDIELLSRASHERGILLGIDCSHSIGAVPHRFAEWGIDFAVWCHYKYLASGPGAVGGLYLNRQDFARMPALAGWFGGRKETQFEMSHDFVAATGASSMQIGTPYILSMAPLEGVLGLVAEAGLDRLREKSLALTEFLIDHIDRVLGKDGFSIGTPRESHRRGGHVALIHTNAVRICKALRAAEVVADFRPPNVIRFAPTALYTSFQECHEAIRRLQEIMERRLFETFSAESSVVS